MKLLTEDMNTLMTKFPGAREFIEAAEQRYTAYKRAKRIVEKSGRAVSGDACQEDWFLDRLKREGLPPPQKKEPKPDSEPKKEEETEDAPAKTKKPAKKKATKKK
jgi:hypothetical protein